MANLMKSCSTDRSGLIERMIDTSERLKVSSSSTRGCIWTAFDHEQNDKNSQGAEIVHSCSKNVVSGQGGEEVLVMIRTESTIVQNSTLIKYLVIARHVAQAASVDAPIAMTTVHGIVCRQIPSAKSPQSAFRRQSFLV